MKAHTKLVMATLILVVLALTSTAGAITWYTDQPIGDVTITSPSDGDIVFAGCQYTLTCTATSTDRDYCENNGDRQYFWDTVVYTWSGPGTFDPTAGTSVTWTAPCTLGDVNICVTATDDGSPYYADDTDKTDCITLKVSPVYVDIDATGSEDGTSWTDAFTNIQDGIDAACSCGQIWVAEGTYTLTSQISVNKAVKIYGGFDPGVGDDTWAERDYVNNVTTIDGDDSVRCLYITADATIDGFTIANGYIGNNHGAGIYCSSASPTIRYCIIAENNCPNSDYRGGGMYLYNSSPTISNCTIADNFGHRYGGGICNSAGSPSITDCNFSGNSTDHWGGGLASLGSTSNPTLDHCHFLRNSAGFEGGGIQMGTSGGMSVTDCNFIENQSHTGGGIYNIDAEATITSCLFLDNSVEYCGGGIYFDFGDGNIANCVFNGNNITDSGQGGYGGALCIQYSSSQTKVTNCTVYENSAITKAGGITIAGTSVLVDNCIFWGDTASECEEIWVDSSYTVEFSHCIIDGDIPTDRDCVGDSDIDGGSNTNDEPDWEDETDPDGADNEWRTSDDGLALESYSDGVDDGDNDAVPEYIEYDFAGNDRIEDDTVDIGAYEY
ncbi:MAG: choice-of-anchor Q domain-containing protein [Planctomycetota bacterium]|jgi:hypothetical protein